MLTKKHDGATLYSFKIKAFYVAHFLSWPYKKILILAKNVRSAASYVSYVDKLHNVNLHQLVDGRAA